MPHLVDCPELESWHALFADAITPEQRADLERHLNSCPFCQECLDRADECGAAMRDLIRRVANTSAVSLESTQVPLVDRLLGPASPRWTAPVQAADLYFLVPSDRAGVLGTLGPYQVEEVIGQGGMGVILKAYEPALHRVIAIKVLSPAVAGSAVARQRFTREAKAAAAVCHDHIVTVHGVFETDGLPYLVMQYVAGQSLQDVLERADALEVEEIVRIGMETARGLAAAHAHGLIHRDIKPANLLLEDGSGRVRITDFGLARMSDDVALTQNGVVTGTPEYMAPEQARGEPVDQRADLFSLGSVLYALCTGAPPFRGSSALVVLNQVSQHAPMPIRALNPEIPAWLEALIARLMVKDPAQRFASAADVASLLEGYLAHLRQPTTVPAPEVPPASDIDMERLEAQPVKRLPRWPWLVAAMFLGGLALAGWFAGGPDDPAPQGKPFQERYFSFKGMTDINEDFHFIGPDAEACVRFEPEGLRITTPPGFPIDHPSLGIAHNTVGKGDFEITTTFAILHEPDAAELGKDHTRVTLDVVLETPDEDLAALSRRVAMPLHGGSQFLAYLQGRDEHTNTVTRHFKSLPTQAKTGQLRVVRTGSVLAFEAAEDSSQEFRRLQEYPFSTANVREVRLVATSGGPKAWLDVRVPDLRIRAESLLNLRDPVPIGGPNKGYLALGLLIAVALAGAVAVWLRRRRSRPVMALPTPGPVPEGAPNGETAKIPFSCSSCGKHLKVKETLAGKKVRCPSCGQVTPVPIPERVGRPT